ncbi:MAG: protein-L-isoaspartate O-methyltransferase, partial [Promethearchaeota archaeon]
MDRDDRLKEQLNIKKKRLLDRLIVNDILKDKRLVKAFLDIPLEKFIPERLINVVKLYEDKPALFYYDENNPKNYRTISAPHMITIMLQGLALSSNDDLLILGAKSGYIAALAHKLAPKGEIIILEANSEIAKITSENLKQLKLDENVTIIVKNPLLGMPDLSPWQKILVTGAIEQSKIYPLLCQLDENGGVLFAPIGPELVQTYTQILRQNDEYFGKKQLDVTFSPLITQIELDELELITDFDNFEDVYESCKPDVQTPNRIEIKYASNILDNLKPDVLDKVEISPEFTNYERDRVITLLEEIIQNAKSLKVEEDTNEFFKTISVIEEIVSSLKKHSKSFELKIK